MGYRDLARDIKDGYNDLKKDTVYKSYLVLYNEKLQIPEIRVDNDAQFKAIVIGDTRAESESRGYMYLFYTNDRDVSFPSIKEIERRLRVVACKGVLTEDDAAYFDWGKSGSLEKQREYFSEIVKRGSKKQKGRIMV